MDTQLRKALDHSGPKDLEFYNSDPVPYVYEKYLQYVATGQYPYNASVEDFIKKDLREELSHEQSKNLGSQVYLASTKYHKEAEKKRQEELIKAGWTMITPDTIKGFKQGQRIIIHRTGHNILCQEVLDEKIYKVAINHEGKVFFMPPKSRTKGFHADSFLVPYADKAQFYKTV